MRLAVHQPQYLPWIGYFHKIASVDIFVFQDDVQYKEREYQNANKIKTPNGPLELVVPVLTHGMNRPPICEALIDNTQKWRRKHWGSITHSYSKAPFFKQYARFFEEVYSRNWEKLVELNMDIIKFVVRELNITTRTFIESKVDTSCKTREDRIIEVCRRIGADTYYSGSGGATWMDRAKFEAAGIKLEFQEFHHPVYPQWHGEFVPYMSVIDLLFNVGPGSMSVIRGAQNWNLAGSLLCHPSGSFQREEAKGGYGSADPTEND